MKNFKILAVFSLLLVSMFSLVGCGNNSSEGGLDKPIEGEHVCQFGEWQVVQEGDCHTVGREARYCTCGEKEERETGVVHNFETIEALEPSCNSNGHTEYERCTSCGEVVNFSEIEKTGHSFGEWTLVEEASCELYGKETRECSSCGEIEENYIDPKGHNYESVVTNPTETTKGYTTHTCSVCGDSYTDSETSQILYFSEYKDGEYEVGLNLGFTGKKSDITSITIPDYYGDFQITKIGNFSGLTNLKEVIIEGTNKSFTIGEGAFEGCTSLEDITIIDDCIIEDEAFKNCTNLNPTYGSFALAKSIGNYVFENCTSLEEFNYSRTSNRVEFIGASAFKGCTSLKELYLPNWSLSKYTLGYYFGSGDYYKTQSSYIPSSLTKVITYDTDITDYAFYYCSSLIEIDFISYQNGLLIGSHVFDGCTALTYLEDSNGKLVKFTNGWVLYGVVDKTVSEFTVSNSVYAIAGSTFVDCENLTTVDLNEVVAIGGSAFKDCHKLSDIDLTDVKLIGENAFENCYSLYSVDLKNVIEIKDEAFLNCYNLVSVKNNSSLSIVKGETTHGYVAYYAQAVISKNITHNIDITDGFVTYTDLDKNITYLLGYNGTESKVTIPETINVIKSYSINDNVTELIIPESVTTIEDSALRNATSLEKLTIPFVGKSPTDSVGEEGTTDSYKQNHFGYIFGRESQSSSDYDFFIPSTLEYIEVTGDYNIPQRAFYLSNPKNYNIKEVVISGNPNQVGSYVFGSASGLEKLTLPYLGANINDKGAIKRYFDFVPSSLTEVTILRGETLGAYAFSDCPNITTINLPNTLITIEEEAFYMCTGLTSIVIPSSVEKIEKNAFYYCSNLTSMIISLGVENIEGSAFATCESVSIYCEEVSRPSGWSSEWNRNHRPVYWAGEWEYNENGEPVPLA